jgi:hypothetical protein
MNTANTILMIKRLPLPAQIKLDLLMHRQCQHKYIHIIIPCAIQGKAVFNVELPDIYKVKCLKYRT